MRIAVCLPIHVSAQISVNFFINFINRLGELDPVKYNPIILFSTKSPVDKSRTQLVDDALARDATHIWFIDCDHVLPRGTLEELLKMDCDIASALYFEKGIPIWPIIRKWDNETKTFIKTDEIQWNGVMEVDGIGLGCCLIKADVFKKLEKPWFKWVWEGEELKCSEDLYFCKKAKEAGYKILVNTKFVVGHQGGLVTEKEFLAYQDMRDSEKAYVEHNREKLMKDDKNIA